MKETIRLPSRYGREKTDHMEYVTIQIGQIDRAMLAETALLGTVDRSR